MSDNLYFNQKQPVKQEPVEKPVDPVTPPEGATELILIRTKETGDKVYRIKQGVAHWVMNPQVMDEIKGSFNDVTTVPYQVLQTLEKGTPISLQNASEFIIEKHES